MKNEDVRNLTFWEVRKWLWESREREISHMWHRGAFLATFIVGTYTGYAKLAAFPFANIAIRDVVLMAVAAICIVWSLLWIAMAKGASAWYEIYEKAIRDLSSEYFQDHTNEGDDILIGIVGEKCPIVKCHNPSELSKWNTSYLSGCGGQFSLPRLNIAIGHLLLIVSVAIYLLHAAIFLHALLGSWFVSLPLWTIVRLVAFTAINLLSIFIYWRYSCKFLRSESLNGYIKRSGEQKIDQRTCSFRMALERCVRIVNGNDERW